MKSAPQKANTTNNRKQLIEINSAYLKTVKPIFLNKCFDCHSNETTYPWYHSLPVVKQFINDDIKEAKKHMDMSNDFPFQGHGNPPDDLNALAAAIDQNSMPPFRYRVLHWDSSLNSKEREVIFHWIKKSQKLLKTNSVNR